MCRYIMRVYFSYPYNYSSPSQHVLLYSIRFNLIHKLFKANRDERIELLRRYKYVKFLYEL